MIDLHSHILPGIDDGAADLSVSLAMARLAVSDGITHMACTPHVLPGLYDNTQEVISAAVSRLRDELNFHQIPLTLLVGADVHVAPDLPDKLAAGMVPTLNRSRYFLFEPPHKILPPRLEELASRLINAGFVPVLTHPERLSWIKAHYEVIVGLNKLGCLMQVTADSVVGDFGRSALYYAERLMDEGRVDIIATDAHGIERRRPLLSKARDVVAARLGEGEARAMVLTRPAAILANKELTPVASNRGERPVPRERAGILSRLFKGSSS